MDKIILYSTHCGHCRMITLMLQKKNIEFEEVYIDPDNPEEVKIMLDMGFKSAPGLVVGDTKMNFEEAKRWIQEQ